MSVEWDGYLMPSATGAHSFFVEADDGIRVTVDGQVVIDHLQDAADGVSHSIYSASTVTLQSGQLVPIKVQYY